MSTPPSFVPPRQYPPNGQRRPRGGCMLWGVSSCLVIFIIIAVAFSVGVYRISRTPGGRNLVKSVGAMMRSEPHMVECSQKMHQVREAIIRYHERNGTFPPSLSALVPKYITDPKLLHCEMDPNTNPTHVTFQYTRPGNNPPGNAPLLSFHWINNLQVGKSAQTMDTELIALLNGQTLSKQTQSITVRSDAAQANGNTVPIKGYNVHKNPDGSVTYSTTTTTTLPQ